MDYCDCYSLPLLFSFSYTNFEILNNKLVKPKMKIAVCNKIHLLFVGRGNTAIGVACIPFIILMLNRIIGNM